MNKAQREDQAERQRMLDDIVDSINQITTAWMNLNSVLDHAYYYSYGKGQYPDNDFYDKVNDLIANKYPFEPSIDEACLDIIYWNNDVKKVKQDPEFLDTPLFPFESVKVKDDKEDSDKQILNETDSHGVDTDAIKAFTPTLRDWYMETYPDDGWGEEVSDDSFMTFYASLRSGYNVYDMCVNDSVIRERIFKKLAELGNVDYDVIYNMWLDPRRAVDDFDY